MKLILSTDNEHNISQIIALAKKLNVAVEQRGKETDNDIDRKDLKNRILNLTLKTLHLLGMQVNGSEMNGMINNPYFLNNHT